MNSFLRVAGLAVLVAGLSIGAFHVHESLAGPGGSTVVPADLPWFGTERDRQFDPGTLPDVAERAVESVVNISSERVVRTPGVQHFGPFLNDPFFRQFFGPGPGHPGPTERRQNSLGSGVIVREDGIILTNNHVVENAEKVKVTLSDGREYDAEIVGTDPPTDLAVLRIQDDSVSLPVLPFGDSDGLRLGEVVLAVGNPFGIGQTVTMGIVSAKGRANVGIVDYEDFIQTDAAINPGNSGGALVDLNGKLVGINTAIMTRSGGYQGVGFAVPVTLAESVMGSLLEDGKVVRGWLGVVIQDVTPDLGTALDLSGKRGALISDVSQDSPAAKAGLERGDVILEFDGKPVSGSARLRNLVAAAGGGKRVKVEILRDGREKTVTVQLGERESEDSPAAANGDSEHLGGLSVAPLDDAARRSRDWLDARVEGVLVTNVVPGSAAERAGFRRDDVILEVARKRIESVRGLERVYEKARGAVPVLVQRGNGTLYLALRKP